MEQKTTQKPQKNDEYVVKIIDIGSNGEGIAKIDNFTMFVPFALPGEEVKIHIVLAKKDYAIAKVIEVLSASSYRIDAPCPYFGKCGGCQLQHATYDFQKDYKKNFVANSLKKYAGLEPKIEDCEPSEPYHYRNKFSFPIGKTAQGVVVGMYRTNSHSLVEIDDCLLQQDCKFIIDAFKAWANATAQPVYLDSGKGLRHLVARINGNNLLLTLVSTSEPKQTQVLFDKLKEKFDEVSIVYNKNINPNNVILGKADKVLHGAGQLSHQEYGIKYTTNCHSFVQVNSQIMHKLYDEVLSQINNNDVVIDAYSGAGVLSCIMAQKCKQVYAIEIVPEAVADANKLKTSAGLKNITNICGDCKIELPKVCKNLKDFAIVIDPPRKGCDKEVIETISQSNPSKIIYISCNPATLARDIALLKDNYVVDFVKPFDMFPQTANVETLLVLRRK